MDYSAIRHATDDHAATVTLSRPDGLNAFTPEAASYWSLPQAVGISQALEERYGRRVFGATAASRDGPARSGRVPGELGA